MHPAGTHADMPPGAAFALDLSGLRVPRVTAWSALVLPGAAVDDPVATVLRDTGDLGGSASSPAP